MKTIFAAALAACVTMGTPAHAAQPMTFEDALHEETLSTAQFSPDGKWLAVVREAPPAGHPSWGYSNALYVRSRVFVAHADGSDLHEIANTKDVHYALLPRDPKWSPDGRGLLLIAARQSGYGLAYYDLAKRTITELPGHSIYGLMSWMPDGRVVYATMGEGVRQPDVHGPLLDGLERRWRAGWNGAASEATVSSPSEVFPEAPRPAGSLMLADPRSGSHRVLGKGDFLEILASKDGRHVAAVRLGEERSDAINQSGKRGALVVFDASGKSQQPVYSSDDTDLSPFDSLSWSPAGNALLFVGRPMHDAQNHPVSYGRDMHAGMRLYEWSPGDAKPRLLSADDLFEGNPDINQQSVLPIGWMGGHPIAIAAHHVAGADSAPASTQSSTMLEYGTTRDTRFDLYVFNDTGNENLTGFTKASVNRFLVPDGADFAFVIADGALWKLAPGKAPQRLTPAGAPPILDFGTDRGYPSPPTNAAYYHAGAIERISLATLAARTVGRAMLDLGSGKLTALSVPGDIVATAPDQMEAFSKAADGWTTALYLNSGTPRIFATLNAALKDRAVAPVERFTFQYNGTSLTGWVVLPPGGGAKLPAVVSVYGGAVFGDQPPSFTRTDFGVPVLSGQLLAQQGYAVIYPSTPLGAGATTNLMATLADQAIAAVDALAAKGTIDPSRVGIMGQSFGGFSTAAILSERSDRFRAGVSMAGVYDWMHGYGLRLMEEMLDDDDNFMATETMQIESSQAQLGKPFWEAPDAYMRNSPIFRADKIDAPLLLLHGDLDLAVTGLSGAERLYNAMLRADKHPTLVRYWGEGHVAQSDWAMRDQWMRITTWFGVYLKGEKPTVH